MGGYYNRIGNDMKQLHQASTSPHYVFKYPNQSIIGDVPFTYQKNFLNKKELKIIEKLSKTLSYEKSSIGDNENSRTSIERRNSMTGWIEYNVDTMWLFDKIFGHAYQNVWGLDVTGIHDMIQYTVYPAENEEQYYHSHRDTGPGTWWRKVSMTIQLTEPDEFEGGGLQIEDPGGTGEWMDTPHEDRGDMIMFPSFMRHQALPVTKGTRKCLVAWISGPPLR